MSLFLVLLGLLLALAQPADAQQPRPAVGGLQQAPSSTAPAPTQGVMPQALQGQPPTAIVAPVAGGMPEYVLGVGDRLKIVVYKEPDMSGEFEIDSTGRVAMPLIGEMLAAGTTIRALERTLEAQLSQGYLRDPKVNVEVMNYRPFFILGEVMKPNSYPFINGMSVMNAVALAGGYTYRADKDKITLQRGQGQEKFKVRETDPVLPGDIINVPERFF